MPNNNQDNNFIWVKTIIGKLKQINFPFYKDVPLYKVIRFVYLQSTRIAIAERASILSFNILMAIPPSLMFVFSLTPYIPLFSGKFHKEVLLVLKEIISDKHIYDNIAIVINDLFYKPKNAIYSLSFILFLFFASNAVMVMIKTFDKSITNKHKRHFVVRRLISIQITLSLFLLFIFLIYLLNIEKHLIKNLFAFLKIQNFQTKPILIFSRNLLSSLYIFFVIGFIYKFSPSIKTKWKLFSPGAIFSTICYLLIENVFNYWTTNYMLYHQKYGPLGTLIFVLTLIYIFSFILLLGFEINLSIDTIKKPPLKK